MEIRTYDRHDRQEVINLILHCQNDGTRPHKTVDDQPEIADIESSFQKTGGEFWVAAENGKIAGCIGLANVGNGNGILKKFFVYEIYRGAPYHLGRQLFEVLKNFALKKEFSYIYLDTPKNTDRAHKFYQKAGFTQIQLEELPFQYHYPYLDCDFFKLEL